MSPAHTSDCSLGRNQQQVQGRRHKILFLDAYDSFSNNITSLLATLLDVDVFVLPIDSPLLDPASPDFHERLRKELSHYVAVVCGPGPGSPDCEADVGLMRYIWTLAEEDLVPVLGICLGFQSLVRSCGGEVRRLSRGLHGMVREIIHPHHMVEGAKEKEVGDIFQGVARFKATLYHSLCGDIGQKEVLESDWEATRFRVFPKCPDLRPLAWVEEKREEGNVERILMGVKHRNRPFWGLQYHPESVCTEKEGNKIIENWFRETLRWNEEHGRDPGFEGPILARNATKPSLLSSLSVPRLEEESTDWWESLDVDAVYHSETVPLPHDMQVPDFVELALGPEESERIILDSANAAAAAGARADVRGRFSIVAANVKGALRIEHHTGDDHATIRLGQVNGLPDGMSQRVPLAPYGGIWGLVAKFHDARHLEFSEPDSSPFLGGFMGYITYEQGLADIGIHSKHPGSHQRPDVCLVWVTKSLVIDHLLGVVHIQHLCATASESDPWLVETTNKLLSMTRIQPVGSRNHGSPTTAQSKDVQPQIKTRRPSRSTAIQTPMTKDYEAKVSLCQEFIAAGDSYELCLTDQTKITRPISEPTVLSSDDSRVQKQRHRSSISAPPSSWNLYKTLRARQPAPFASYLRLGAATLVSASPERFLQYDRVGRCSMRPMKGTVRKSEAVPTLAEAEKILHVPKEEAENLMIVDLVRHDLHGICGAGRVTVSDLLKVEEYQSVFQMITVVEGQLPRPEERQEQARYTGLDVLAASLPPGSMTGAPKKRSCEILHEIEQGQERSLYSGVVGYMCATGRGDWSVTIRSLFRWDDEQTVTTLGRGGTEERNETWHIGAGGAVTILSTPEGEREEMFTKLAGPLRVFADSG
ncbi:Aminodeoxychorismate synthase [Rhypophila decipiens]|uniref:aminodeoxychorismate synthase n=1 Tax=Rhypophila decipiens TaxID=261697 RepID=A0AAN6Y707_9PEZI|nr:Aminodeoxychorismate synthase [Rhypophila decipiens]